MMLRRRDKAKVLRTHWAALAGAVALAALALGHPAGAGASTTSSSGGSWIILDSGHLGDQDWSVKATSGGNGSSSQSGGSRHSCISIGAVKRMGPFDFRRSSYRNCDPLDGRSSAATAPLVATGVFTAGGKNLTAVGMIFPSGVRRAQVTFSDGSSTVIAAQSLTGEEARRVGLDDYRHAAFAVRGPWCATSLTTLSRTGRALWSGAVDTPC